MSDQQMLAVNRLAEKLQSAIPGAKVCFLAYYGTATPPKKVKPAAGVFLEYAPMNRDFAQPAFCVAQAEKENMAALMDVFGRADATVLEYWYDNSMFSKWTKPPKPFTPRHDLIPGDVKWYKEMGFEHIASFACYLGADFEALYGPPDISAFA